MGAGTDAERLAVLSKLLANNEKGCEYLVVACRRPPESQGFLLPLRRSYSTRGRLLAVVLILHALPHVASAERPFLFEAASPAAARKKEDRSQRQRTQRRPVRTECTDYSLRTLERTFRRSPPLPGIRRLLPWRPWQDSVCGLMVCEPGSSEPMPLGGNNLFYPCHSYSYYVLHSSVPVSNGHICSLSLFLESTRRFP